MELKIVTPWNYVPLYFQAVIIHILFNFISVSEKVEETALVRIASKTVICVLCIILLYLIHF